MEWEKYIIANTGSELHIRNISLDEISIVGKDCNIRIASDPNRVYVRDNDKIPTWVYVTGAISIIMILTGVVLPFQ